MQNKICKEAIYHVGYGKYAYQDLLDNKLVVIIRTKKNDVDSINVRFGDPFNFEFKDKTGDVTQFGGGDEMRWVEDCNIGMKKILSDELFDYYKAKLFHPSKRIRYVFELKKGNEKLMFGEHGYSDDPMVKIDKLGFTWGYLDKGNILEIPSWVYNTVWYQIFPERFANGNTENDPDDVLEWNSQDPTRTNYFGGDIRGVIENLDHIVDLGCNGIYFTPIFKANTNHKYDTEDYLKIDPQFGSEKTFKELIDKAHEKGIKIMIDGVFNHCGDKFPQWQDVVKNKEASQYFDWFFVYNSQDLRQAEQYPAEYFKKVDRVYDTFAHTPHMPRLNWANTELQKYLKEVTKKWTSFGIDAWRLDVANEPPLNFWRKFRKWVKDVNPENFVIGEIWYDSNLYLKGDTFDSVMNYRLRNMIMEAIQEKWNKNQFLQAFSKYSLLYTDTVKRALFNLLSSHDTPRLLTVFKNNVKDYLFAYKLMFTMLGNPCVYYGDEIGMDGEHDPMCRKCMEWDKSKWNMEIYNTISKLIHIRKSTPELYMGDYELVDTNNEYVFIIKYTYEEGTVYSCINLSDKPQTLKFKDKVICDLFNEKLLFDEMTIEAKDVFIAKIRDNQQGKELGKDWWKRAVVYQIYPISFKDSNKDGKGDLNGVIQKLPYLADLGVNAIWLNPIYASPMQDNGYDVSDYFKINPIYGDLTVVENLIKTADALGIKIVLDIIPNHTSSEHEWFKKAINHDPKYQDYYYFSKNPDLTKESVFGGPAWKKIDNENYYLHSFAEQQPDLNWNNESVIDEFARIIDFWIDKGAYGFRFDVIDDIAKNLDPEIIKKQGNLDFDKLHKMVQKWRSKSKWLDKDLLTVGESWNSTVENAQRYSNPNNKELAMVFGFEHLMTNWTETKWNWAKVDLVKLKQVIEKWQHGLHNSGWNSLFVNNHDFPRVVSNFGSKRCWKESAKAIALTFHMLQGTPFIYQGEEIGMRNCEFNDLSEHRDIEVLQMFEAMKAKNPSWTQQDHLKYVKKMNRDNARTPMQWDYTDNAGFCDDGVTPWIKVNPNNKWINVGRQRAEPFSILHWYKALVHLRRSSEISAILEKGDFKLINSNHSKLFMYERNYENKKLILVANWSYIESDIELSIEHYGKVLMDNYDDFDFKKLKPWQAVLMLREIKK